MRKLFVARGVPGSGKSTLLEAAGLGPYTLSPDVLRMAMNAPVLDETGKMSISAKQDNQVWELLRDMLEKRMARGEVVAIDATHTVARYYNEYAQLAYRYRYEMYIIDLSDVPLEEIRRRNALRAEHKIVNDSVLVEMQARLQKLSFPKGWRVLKNVEDIQSALDFPTLDFSAYKAVYHIGDIQGCYDPLAEFIRRFPLQDDIAYVFVGDLLDRGSQNDQVLRYISHELTDRPNVYFVEGNHDLYIWQWLHDWPVKSREFNGRTRRQLDAADIDKKAVRTLFKSMVPALRYRRGNHDVLVTHAGLSTLPANLGLIAAEQCIRGVGAYDQVGGIDENFMATTTDRTYQIHGHRNRQEYPTVFNQRCFNLEGKVEFGGSLRVVCLSDDGFESIEIANKTVATADADYFVENGQLLRELRNNRLISERTLPENISSFHYRPEVMFRKKWSKQTMTTRGLFINTLSNEIVIRAYDKFFNVGETRQTDYEKLADTLVFPVTAWVKENGYLGLVGYDSLVGDLVFSSKTTTEGDFADWFRRLFEATYLARPNNRQVLMDFLEKHNATLVCEVLLPDRDPHIISYQQDEIVALELIKRQRTYEALPIQELDTLADYLSMRRKKQAAVLPDWQAFESWYQTIQAADYMFDGAPIEGFVIEDANGWHVKIKLEFYMFWKQMRTVLDAIKKGKNPKVPDYCAYPDEAEKVISFMQHIAPDHLATMRIIDVRQQYFGSRSD